MEIKTGKDIKLFREINNLTQRKLAEILGVKRSAVAWPEYKHPDEYIPLWLHTKFKESAYLDRYDPVYKKDEKKGLLGKMKKWVMRVLG